jgi:hypothetical protein
MVRFDADRPKGVDLVIWDWDRCGDPPEAGPKRLKCLRIEDKTMPVVYYHGCFEAKRHAARDGISFRMLLSLTERDFACPSLPRTRFSGEHRVLSRGARPRLSDDCLGVRLALLARDSAIPSRDDGCPEDGSGRGGQLKLIEGVGQ